MDMFKGDSILRCLYEDAVCELSGASYKRTPTELQGIDRIAKRVNQSFFEGKNGHHTAGKFESAAGRTPDERNRQFPEKTGQSKGIRTEMMGQIEADFGVKLFGQSEGLSGPKAIFKDLANRKGRSLPTEPTGTGAWKKNKIHAIRQLRIKSKMGLNGLPVLGFFGDNPQIEPPRKTREDLPCGSRDMTPRRATFVRFHEDSRPSPWIVCHTTASQL